MSFEMEFLIEKKLQSVSILASEMSDVTSKKQLVLVSFVSMTIVKSKEVFLRFDTAYELSGVGLAKWIIRLCLRF